MSHRSRYASFAAAKEAISKMKVNLDFINFDGRMKSLLITSAVENEGKSFVAAQLAKSLAANGKRVLLIDADMRGATQQDLFNLPNRSGLSGLFTTHSDWRKSLNQTETELLQVLAAGRTPPNPAELLGSKYMRELLGEMKQQYDCILIDTPPVLPVPDTLALSQCVDGVVIVTRWGKTARKYVKEAGRALNLIKAPIIGSILNDVRPKKSEYYYH